MEGLVQLLQSLSTQAQKTARRLTEYRQLLSDPVNNAHARGRILSELERDLPAMPDSEVRGRIAEWLKAERAVVESSRDEFRFEFGRRFAAGLEGSGMALKGQLPVLRVGMFTVKADFEAGSATVFWGPEIEKLKSGVGLEPSELASTLRAWNERLQRKSVEPERLAKLVHTAYRRIKILSGQPEGTRVFLLDLLSELVLLIQPEGFRLNPAQEKFVEYPRVRFSFDLYRLKSAGIHDVAGDRLRLHVANFDATVEKAKALWVPDNAEGDGTHYSYVSFTRGA